MAIDVVLSRLNSYKLFSVIFFVVEKFYFAENFSGKFSWNSREIFLKFFLKKWWKFSPPLGY